MTISVSFSGGISHAEEVSQEKQAELRAKIADGIRAVLEENAASGSGSVFVGSDSLSFSATSNVSV